MLMGFYGGMNYGGNYDSWGPGMMGFGGTPFGIVGGMFFGVFMLAIVLWTLYWKYQALWYAAKHDHKWWFIAMLVINTVGILEIAYLYYFSKQMDAPKHDEGNVPMVPPQG